MQTDTLNERAIESLLLEHLANAGYICKSGKEIERKGGEWMLENEFREAVQRVNFGADSRHLCNLALSIESQERLISEALQKLKALENEELMEANAKCHAYLTRGITLEVFFEGETRGVLLRLLDFENPSNNSLLACNQLHFAAPMPKTSRCRAVYQWLACGRV
ncbi:type I restriction endonuclease [Helicobacter sp.]|uniref:type I restriction endonuclease n=1 Tax=Helicobacter sp. TaxID=218 RepID=UPI0025BB2805|nr:type I restriction endonuclease [Helicobacter sp.]